jgi:cation:H+ antiporter
VTLTPAWSIWLQFLLISGAILVSGSRLSRYADVLAEKTHLGRTWIGLTGLAVVTSLPELVTGASAVLWVGVPDIAVGNLLGACVMNLAILAVADLVYPPGPVLSAADRGHVLAAAFGVVMLGIASLASMARNPVPGISLRHLGLSTPVLLICYLVAMRATYRYQQRERAQYLKEHVEEVLYPELSLKTAVLRFGVHAGVVVAAAVWLPRVAENLGQLMGWHLSLVGTVYVAAVTTLPELVVTVSAVRLGAVDLGVGNLLGSVMANVAMLGVMDLLYFEGPLLRAAAPGHAATGVVAMVMTGIASVELMYRPQKKVLRWMSLGAFLLAFLYAGNVLLQTLAR